MMWFTFLKVPLGSFIRMGSRKTKTEIGLFFKGRGWLNSRWKHRPFYFSKTIYQALPKTSSRLLQHEVRDTRDYLYKYSCIFPSISFSTAEGHHPMGIFFMILSTLFTVLTVLGNKIIFIYKIDPTIQILGSVGYITSYDSGICNLKTSDSERQKGLFIF